MVLSQHERTFSSSSRFNEIKPRTDVTRSTLHIEPFAMKCLSIVFITITVTNYTAAPMATIVSATEHVVATVNSTHHGEV